MTSTMAAHQGRGMRMQRTLLGIDIGTSSIKVALINEDMRVVAIEKLSYRVEHPQKGWAQIGADTLWNSMIRCLQKIAIRHSLSSVCAIGLSCMSPGLVALGKNGQVLADPILYLDRRSTAQADAIKALLDPDEFFSITANNVMAGTISCTSMLWLKQERPEIYEQTRWFGHLNTLMCYRLTGVAALDRCNASYTGLFSTAGERKWSAFLCNKIGIDISKLPPLLESIDVCGELCARDVIACGVPKGIPVVIGGADSACAAFACGVISPYDICQSVGSTNVLTLCIDKTLFSRAYLNRCHVVPGLWLYQGAMSNAGSVVNWALDTLCDDLKALAKRYGEVPWHLLDLEALKSVPGANGVVFLPYLSGERCPIWDPCAKGVFFGLTRATMRHDLVRAILESTCYATRQILQIAESITQHHYDCIDTVGGGARSEIWTQMRADIMGRSMRMLTMTDAAVHGAAMLAGIGAGVYRDVREAVSLCKTGGKLLHPNVTPMERAIYDQRFDTYLKLYPAVKDFFELPNTKA